MQKSVLGSSSELFAAFSKRDGEVARRVVLFIQEELGVGSKRMQAWSANLKKSSTLSRKLYWSSRRCSMCAGLKTAFRCARLSTRICSFRISILAKPELRSRMNVAEL
jgi:hypothetical protein